MPTGLNITIDKKRNIKNIYNRCNGASLKPEKD